MYLIFIFEKLWRPIIIVIAFPKKMFTIQFFFKSYGLPLNGIPLQYKDSLSRCVISFRKVGGPEMDVFLANLCGYTIIHLSASSMLTGLAKASTF